ncbi:MAG: hypothetical protein QXT14_03015 [Candidatus Bathyarchaeia archaeon]
MNVRKLSDRVFEVESESMEGKTYVVWFDPWRKSWRCTCMDFSTRLRSCKHIALVNRLVLDGVVGLG